MGRECKNNRDSIIYAALHISGHILGYMDQWRAEGLGCPGPTSCFDAPKFSFVILVVYPNFYYIFYNSSPKNSDDLLFCNLFLSIFVSYDLL